MNTQIDDRAVPIDESVLEAILNRVKGLNTIWTSQESGLVYLDFPENFPVREMHGDLLGYLIWDEAYAWQFMPVTHDEQDRDSRARQQKNQPEPPPL